jgi:glycerophosphoryl diester phosphodiesterase
MAFLDGPTPRVFAHRGWHTGTLAGLENSAAAFRAAVEHGIRYLETDVHCTADGVLVAFHDAVLDRVTDGTGRIAELPWSTVRTALIGGREPIPRFVDLLSEFPDACVNVDPKDDRAVGPLLDAVAMTGAGDRLCIGSFSTRRLLAVGTALGPRVARSLGPAEVGALLRASLLGRRFRLPAVGRPVAVQVPTRFRRVELVTRRFLDTAHAAGLEVHVWTIDQAPEMHRLLDLGVDGIMSDRPDVLLGVLADRGR